MKIKIKQDASKNVNSNNIVKTTNSTINFINQQKATNEAKKQVYQKVSIRMGTLKQNNRATLTLTVIQKT